MNQDLSLPALIKVIKRHYPSGISNESPQYESTEEARHLAALTERGLEDEQVWEQFIQGVKATFPECHLSARAVSPHQPSYKCEVRLPKAQRDGLREEDALTCLLSLLAPVYALFASHQQDDGLEKESWRRFPPLPQEFQTHESKLAALVESTFGFTRLPNDVLFAPLSDMVPPMGQFSHRKARVIHFLF